MEVKEAIYNRRAIYPEQFNGSPVSKETIGELLELANWAPSHRKTEPWRFKVIQGKALKNLGFFLATKYKETTPQDKFSEFKYNKHLTKPQKAGVIIAICMQRDIKERVPEWEEIAATAMAVQNLWLAVTAKGLGGYWSSPSLIQFMDGFFDLEAGERCLGFFYLGHHDTETVLGKRGAIDQKIEWLE